MAGTAADALGTYGVDIYADWSAARLDDFDEKAAERLSLKLAEPDAWLVACVSERSKDTDPLRWVLEIARAAMDRRRYALLPVRYELRDWNPPAIFSDSPRIEERLDDLVIVRPDSTYLLPLRRWLRLPT